MERSSRPTLQTAKNAILVGSSHISHGRSRPRERKAATDAVVGPVVFKTARKFYRVRVILSLNMEVKKFSE